MLHFEIFIVSKVYLIVSLHLSIHSCIVTITASFEAETVPDLTPFHPNVSVLRPTDSFNEGKLHKPIAGYTQDENLANFYHKCEYGILYTIYIINCTPLQSNSIVC